MTSISCSETVWTTSRRFWSSPSGHWTNLVCGLKEEKGIVSRMVTGSVLIWTTHIRAHRVVVSCLGETSSNLGDLAGSCSRTEMSVSQSASRPREEQDEPLSMVITSPAVTFSFVNWSIIFCPRSYTVSMSVLFIVSLPVLVLCCRPNKRESRISLAVLRHTTTKRQKEKSAPRSRTCRPGSQRPLPR